MIFRYGSLLLLKVSFLSSEIVKNCACRFVLDLTFAHVSYLVPTNLLFYVTQEGINMPI